MANNGWIKLHRKIMDGAYWLSESFTRAQAWIDLLLLANHTSGHIRKRGIFIEVQRGQVGFSEESLAARWKWSRGKVIRFLSELIRVSQISRIPVQQNSKLSSLITIVNYDLYQSNGTTDSTTDGQQTVQEQECKNKKKQYSSSFVSFWTAYPRKVGKDAAWRVWQKRNGDIPDLYAVLSSIKIQKASEAWKEAGGKYIPHPATWLNQGRWADEIPEVKPTW